MSAVGGPDAAGAKQHEDASFPVKIQGAGIEPFELQVQSQTAGPFRFPVFTLFIYMEPFSSVTGVLLPGL